MLLSPKAAFAAAALAATSLLLSSGPAHAAPGPDQSQTTASQGYGIKAFNPVGQSFTPTQTSLDFVMPAFDGIVVPTTA